MLLAGAIFVLTIVLVIWQPKGLGIGWSATLGAVLALISGVVHFGDIPVVWNIVWNATATFIAVIIISLLLDESGFFEWAALHVSRWGNGRGRLLFTYIVLLGAAVAALFANDGAALILTPIVIAMLLALGFSKGTTLAFVMAAGFIADTASLPLIVSNLVNIVSADFFGLGFTEYASVMVPVDIAAIIATLVMLHLFFRKDIPPTYDLALLKAPAKAIKDLATFRTGWIVLILLLVGFFVLEPLGIPVSAIAAVGISVRALLRKNVEPYEELGLAEDKFTDDQLIDFMLQHPILINRPIVVTPLGTKLCRPSEVVLDILPDAQKAAFTKEDGEKVVDDSGKRLK